MKAIHAIYKGDRRVELSEDADLPGDTAVVVVVPEARDEAEMRRCLEAASEAVFARLWDNEADDVWNEYL